MAERGKPGHFTVYLEGHEGHRGNVLLRPFYRKLRRLELVLNKLERAYLSVATRRSDFEIVDAEKVNPTSLTLRVVSHVMNYNPRPAFDWGMEQIAAVGRGGAPDERVTTEIAADLVELSTREAEDDYRAFWINGQTDAVRFDDSYRQKAERLVLARRREEVTTAPWYAGVSSGAVVGELNMVDDTEGDRRIVVVPPVGTDEVRCTFPESMRDKLGAYLFKMVRVRGMLHYDERSPFPFQVDVAEDGIELVSDSDTPNGLSELRGVFADSKQDRPDWDSLLNGG